MDPTRLVTHTGFPGQQIRIMTEDFDPEVHNVTPSASADLKADRRKTLEAMNAADLKAELVKVVPDVEYKNMPDARAAILAAEFPE